MYKDLNNKKQAYRNLCELRDLKSFDEILRHLLQKHRETYRKAFDHKSSIKKELNQNPFTSDDPEFPEDISKGNSSMSLIDRSSSYNLIETNHLWIKMYYATLLMSISGMPDFWNREVFTMNFQEVCQFFQTHQEYLMVLFNIKEKNWDEELAEASGVIEFKNQSIRKMNDEIEQKNNEKQGKKGKRFKLKPLLQLWDHDGLRKSCMKFCSSILGGVFGISFQLDNHHNAGKYKCITLFFDKWNLSYRKNKQETVMQEIPSLLHESLRLRREEEENESYNCEYELLLKEIEG